MAGDMRQPRIVLVNTSHPGNIGATARAMKNMGLEQLCLVSPQHYPSAEATARASGADDLLARAVAGEGNNRLTVVLRYGHGPAPAVLCTLQY